MFSPRHCEFQFNDLVVESEEMTKRLNECEETYSRTRYLKLLLGYREQFFFFVAE